MSRTIAFPFHIDDNGSVASEEHPANQLTNRVFSVIATQPGTRIMRPTYGTNIEQFLFGTGGKLGEVDGTIQGADAADMRDVARAAIGLFEKDAVLDTLRITQMPDSKGVMRVEVNYRPTATAAAQNPNVVVREVVVGSVDNGTFSESSVGRPTFFDRTGPEYTLYYQDEDGVTEDSGLNEFGDWSIVS